MSLVIFVAVIIVVLFLAGFLIAEDSISVRKSIFKAFMISLVVAVAGCILVFLRVVDVITLYNEYPMIVIGFILFILILYPAIVGIITILSNFTNVISYIGNGIAAFILLIVWPISFLFSLIDKYKKRGRK